MSLKDKSINTGRLLKSLGHPLRQRILVELNRKESSPSRLAEVLDEPLGNVSYHVKVLLEHDAIELVGTKPVRGALEHTYRAIERPYLDDDHWARLPVSVRRRIFDDTLQDIWEHVVDGAQDGGLDHPRAHISWTPLELDEQGHEEVSALLSDALERVLAIQAEAAGRLAELDEDEREVERTELAVMHYHRPRAADPSRSSKSRARRSSKSRATRSA